MKKTLIVVLTLLLPLAWAWAAGEDAGKAVSSEQQEAKWQPEYGPKGDLLNPEPGVSLFRSSNGGTPETPVIATTLLFEDFELPADWTGSNPPTGWAVIDSGSNPPVWNTYDWYRYASFGGFVARVSGATSSSDNNDWLISPDADFSTATACTLSFRQRYDDYSLTDVDTGFVLLSDDGGSTWGDTVFIFAGLDYGTSTVPDTQVFDISSFAAGKSTVSVGFQYSKSENVFAGAWYMDEVVLNADGVPLVSEDFESAWGTYGDNPPAGWTILDFNPPFDNNDWHQYSLSSWGNLARIYYSPVEDQNEWLISPSMDLSAGYDQLFFSFKQFYNDFSGDTDTGWVYGTTDNWATTTEVAMFVGTDYGTSSSPDYQMLDITSWANGNSDVKLAFKYVGNNDLYWYVDSVQVEGITLPGHDVMSTAINAPIIGLEGFDNPVSVDVYNGGTNTETFDDSVNIWQLHKSTILFENFSNPQGWDGSNPPTNTAGTWAIIDSGSVPGTWDNNDWHAYYYSTWSDTIARVNFSPIEAQNEWLITPSLDLTSATDIHLTFKQWYNDFGTTQQDTGWVLGTTDNWATTVVVDMYIDDQGTSSAPAFPDYDISSWAAGQSSVKIAFKYVGNDDLYWYLDNVEVYELLTPTLVYSQSENVSGLTSLETRTINYTTPFSNPTAGDYLLQTFTNLGTDEDNSNDSLSSLFTVYPHFDSGGPDAGNYHWVDNVGNGPAFNWYDISGTGTQVVYDAYTTGDDRRTSSRSLGFPFFYYGVYYDSIFISENGFASFDTITGSELTNYQIPSTSGQENILALLWDDLNESGGAAYYQTVDYDGDTDAEFILQFDNYQYYSSSLNSTIQMQMILDPTDYSITFQYNQHGPDVSTSHTVGIENAAGDIGLQYIYNGDPFGNTPVAGLAITFRFVAPSIDAALTSIDEPLDGALVINGTTVTPTVTVTNIGDAATTMDVTYIINDGISDVYNQTETTASVPGGGGTLQHSFATTWNATPDGVYDVTAFVVLTGDANAANDTMTSSFDVATHFVEGGPDDFGYRWIDNRGGGVVLEDPPVFNYVDISATGDSLTNGDFGGSDATPLGFSFPFYGNDYDSIWVSNDGYVEFQDVSFTSGNDCPLPNESTPNVPMAAIFWDDMYLRSTDSAYALGQFFDDVVDYYVIQWHNVVRYGQYGDPMDFEIILYADGTILYQYLHVNDLTYGRGQSATIGMEDDAIPSGLTYECNNSTNPGNLLSDSLAIKWYIPVYAHNMVVEEFVVPAGAGVANVPIDPEVLFANGGTNDETNVPVYLYIDPGAYADTQTIASLDSGMAYSQVFSQFTPASSGTYTLTAVGNLAGDEDPLSDTLELQYVVYGSLLDFESFNGGFAATNDWEWGTPSGDSPPAFSGDKCWGTVLAGIYPAVASVSDLDFEVEITGSAPAISFMEWRSMSTSSGYARVFADSGAGYELLSERQGSEESWQPFNVDLTGYSGSVAIRLEFEHSTFVGSYLGWYIDDMGLVDCDLHIPDHDVATTEFIVPGISGMLDPFTPEVSFANFAHNGETDVPVYLYIDPGAYADTQTIATLDSGSVVSQQFLQFTPPSSGTYTLTAVSDLAGDEVPDNDTLVLQFAAYDEFLDFEADDGGFIPTNEWEWGTPTNVGPTSAFSGVNCWGTDLDDYRDNGSAGNPVISDLDFDLDLGNDNNATISFMHWYEVSSATFDSITVKVDPGTGFVTLADWNLNSGDQWELASIDLSAYTGIVTIRLEMWSVSGVTSYAGWYIDDMAFTSCGFPAAGCDYVIGDVNGSDSYNGLDITFGVAFFKGGPDPLCPYGTCPISPCDAFFYCGDVNGSCSYNGLDITYGVAYLKGGPAPIPCPSCPPVGGPATIGNQLTPSVEPAKIEKSKPKTKQLNSTKKGNSLNK